MPVASGHSLVQQFSAHCSERELKDWSEQARCELEGPITFGFIFATPDAQSRIRDVIEVVRIYAQVPVLIGCSSEAVLANDREFENEGGFSVALHALPETTARAFYLPPRVFEDSAAAALEAFFGEAPKHANAWMLFAAPTGAVSESWMHSWDRATGGTVTVGGFASGMVDDEVALYCGGRVYTEGAVALCLEGRVTVAPVASQACRPVGSPWTITRASENVIHQIGNRPILEVLRDTLEKMSTEDQKQARGNIFIGLVMDEYKPNFGTGDFLVRNLAAIDPKSGAVAIASEPRVGQNLQFQIRDATVASVDFEQLLEQRIKELRDSKIYGACLCDCIGRGYSLFGVPDHDVRLIRGIFPDLPVGGLFCNGEFGPVHGRTVLHGYTASLALFVERRGLKSAKSDFEESFELL